MNTQLWKLHISLLKSVGLWATCQENLVLKTIFWLHFGTTVLLLIIFEIVCLIKFLNEDFVEFVKTFGTVLYHLICTITIIIWLNKLELPIKIYNLIDRNSFVEITKNSDFVKKSTMRAKLLSFTMLFSFLMAAFSSLTISYGGVCLFPQKIYNNITEEFFWVKPYNSYTFLNLEKVFFYTNLCKHSRFYRLIYLCT